MFSGWDGELDGTYTGTFFFNEKFLSSKFSQIANFVQLEELFTQYGEVGGSDLSTKIWKCKVPPSLP